MSSRRTQFWRCLVAAALVAGVSACGSAGHGSSGSAAPKNIVIGYGNGDERYEFLNLQYKALKALAAKHGWKTIELNNASDGPTAVNNVNQFIQDHVNYIIEFQIDATVNPVICAKTQAAHIPVVTEGIPGPCEYFTSASDHAAGLQAGTALGDYAKSHWNCQPDLVMLAVAPAVGEPNTARVGGEIQGLEKICPNITSSSIAEFQLSNDIGSGIAAARNVLVAHPSAVKILVSGLNDEGTTEGLTAAEQLHRAGSIYGWGADGSDLGTGADPHLAGSVQFFLEAGIFPAFTIVQELADGQSVHKGFSPQNPTLLGASCAMNQAQAAAIPAMAARIPIELANYPKKTPAQLWCPKA